LETIREVNVELIDQLLKLRHSEQLKLFLLSNTNPIHWSHIKELLRDLEYETAWLSFEHNILKPDAQFFTRFLNVTNFDVASCIFLDDNLRNINTAASLGVRSIQYIGNPQTISELKSCYI